MEVLLIAGAVLVLLPLLYIDRRLNRRRGLEADNWLDRLIDRFDEWIRQYFRSRTR